MKLLLPLVASALVLTMACYRHKQPGRKFPVHRSRIQYVIDKDTNVYYFDSTHGWKTPWGHIADTLWIYLSEQIGAEGFNTGVAVKQLVPTTNEWNIEKIGKRPDSFSYRPLFKNNGSFGIGSQPGPQPIPDTTKPKYHYFIRHNNPQRYFQALDTMNLISSMTGKAMTRDNSDYWMEVAARNLRILYYEGKLDSTLIKENKK